MKHIEGLLFDIGGVVIEIDFDRAFSVWEKWSELPLHKIRSRFKMDNAYEQHERGEISATVYFDHLRQVLSLNADDAEIASGWNSIFLGEISETVNSIHFAKNKIPCFALTNSNPTHQQVWMKNYPRAVDAFQRIFVSSQLRLRKPERRVFKKISDMTGILLENMLFFDDTEENVVAAQAIGMPTILVRSPSDVTQTLSNLITDRIP